MPHAPGSSDALPPVPAVPRVVADAADRRTVRRVAAVGAAAVAATALATAGVASGAGAGSGSSTGFGPGSGSGAPGGESIARHAATASASASPTASASAAAPQLRIQIAYSRVGRELTLTFTFAGYVVEPLTSAGRKMSFPTPAKRDIGMGETLAWGDGTKADSPVAGRRCPVDAEPRTVHQVADTYSAKKTYAGPGTYTINYSYAACGLKNGKIAGTLSITIPK